MTREAVLARTLVELADTLVDHFDVVELLNVLTDQCVEMFDVSAAGLMLVGPNGNLQVMASSSDAMRILELFELQTKDGPCLDAYHTGKGVMNRNLTADDGRWPQFAPVAVAAGFKSVHALPMRLRGSVLGALNLFRTEVGTMDDADVVAAQAFADMATIAVIHHQATREVQLVNDQLTHALNSRVVIEQAKGMVAEREGIDMERTFSLIRSYARSHNLRLVDVARDIVDGVLAAGSLDPASEPS